MAEASSEADGPDQCIAGILTFSVLSRSRIFVKLRQQTVISEIGDNGSHTWRMRAVKTINEKVQLYSCAAQHFSESTENAKWK